MLIGLEAKEGDIFRKGILEKIKIITDEIKFHPDAIRSQVISIKENKNEKKYLKALFVLMVLNIVIKW